MGRFYVSFPVYSVFTRFWVETGTTTVVDERDAGGEGGGTDRIYLRLAGGPGSGKLIFVVIRILERISLRHFSGKYRDAEGAPGSFFEPGSWG
jgi:hypothetical protein